MKYLNNYLLSPLMGIIISVTATTSIAQDTLTIPNKRDSSTFTSEQIREIVRDEISKNPQLIVETLQMFEAELRNQAERELIQNDTKKLNKYTTEIYKNPYTPTFGNDGEIIIVEFFDYNCSFCKKASPTLNKVIDVYNVKRVYKEFPILSQDSLRVGAISQSVMNTQPQAYEEFHKKLFKIDGPVTQNAAIQILNDMGLNSEQLLEIASSEENIQILKDNSLLAENLGIQGTPAFIIGDTILRGAPTYENLQDIIENLNKE
jgi:protein-disulfide isomerase